MELRESAFTVVITDDDVDGQAVVELAEEWHAKGLLDDFAVVRPSAVQAEGPGPATVTADVIGADDPVELLRLLGSRPRRLIRLVVLHLLTHEDSDARQLVDTCERVAELVHRAMPASNGTGGQGVRLLRVNLLVPESDVAPQQAAILQPGWEINGVVSPEDRPAPDRLSVFVRSGANLHGHALAAAASIGGLWRGMDRAPFDGRELDSTTGADDVLVVRCQARLIAGNDRSEILAQAVIESMTSHEDGAVRAIDWGFSSDRPTQVVHHALEKIWQEPEWTPVQRQPDSLEKVQLSMRVLIGDWLRFQSNLPWAAVGFFGGKARTAVERGLTNTFAGADSGVVGRITPLSPNQAAALAAFRLGQLSKDLEPHRLEEDAATWGQSSPVAWRALRDAAIGLVDGSELPSGISRQRRANLDEVLPPSYITPPPEDAPALGPSTPRAVDVEATARLYEAVKATSHERPAADEETAPQPAEQVNDGQPGGDASNGAATMLESWVGRRRDSLFWRLASTVYDIRREEGSRAAAAADALVKNGEAPSPRELVRAKTSLILCWSLALAGLLLGGLLIWLQTTVLLENWLETPIWQQTLMAAAVILVVFFVGGHIYYRALKKYEWAVRTRLHALRVASDEYVTARQQEKRWALMYAGVLDWNDILAELLHRPWSDRQLEHEERESALTGLPAAVAVAVPSEQSVVVSPDHVMEALEAICRRGWVKEGFGRLIEASYENDPARNGSLGDLAADLDLGLRHNGARADLLKTIRSDGVRETATMGVVEDIRRLSDQDRIRTPSLRVQRTGEYSTDEPQEDREFLEESNNNSSPFAVDLFSDRALVAQQHLPEATYFSLPRGVSKPTLTNAQVQKSTLPLVTRVDVSRVLRPNDLKMFQRREADAVRPQAEGADDFN